MSSQASSRCRNCGRLQNAHARRCPGCGNRILAPVQDKVDNPYVVEKPPADPRPSVSQLKLTELQRNVLDAAQHGKVGERRMVVCGAVDGIPGEIKSGGKRFYGNDAVVAIAELAAKGLVSQKGQDQFELTDLGSRAAVHYEMQRRFRAPVCATAGPVPTAASAR